MKKLKLFISLWFTMFSMVVFGQAEYEKIAITQNTQDNTAGRLLVQDVTTGEVRWILKSILDNKFNQPTGNATQYLDGAGNPTTFPVLSQSDRVITEVRNSTGATITKGTVVYLNGATGGKPNVQKAQANAEATSSGTFGVIQSDINNNSNGYVVVIGTVLGLNTSAYTSGQVLWLSPTTAGGFTTTKPVAPNHAVYVGIVTLSATQGTIEVKIQNGYELDEIHDVLITSKTDNDALIYDSATGLWKNKQFVSDAIVDGTTTFAPSQNAVFDALASKEPTIATGMTYQYYRGDKTWQTLDETAVGLGNVDNTSDANKPISTATQTALNAKENTIAAGTTSQYWRGDKTWQTLPSGGTLDGTGTNNFLTKWSSTNTVNASGAWRETSNRLANAADNGNSDFQVTGQIDLKSKNTQGDGGQLGAELLTTGTGDASWTGTSFATGYTHSTGSVTTLTSALAPVINNVYQVAYTVTGRTAGSFNIAFGGATTAGIISSSAVGHRASTTGTLVITPTSDFNGTIVLSIKQITAGTASFVFRDNGGTVRSELRILGTNNTASGLNALQNNTTGTNNTASGLNALQNNTTGTSNTASGVNALLNNTTGSYNTASGLYALLNNTTGTNNTASGLNAGRFISNGATSLTVANNSTFLGVNTKALSDNSTNETVVGYNAIGDGNNTVSIGNTSVVSSRLRGRILQGGVVDNLTDSGQFSGNVLANGFKTASGTASQFLKANGSVDSNTYLTSASLPTVDQTIIDGSTNAVSGNAVFDGLALKANLASPTFTGTVSGITKTMVGLGNVDNTSDANKPISTATQTALNAKENVSNKNIANGYAGLGSDGKLISSQLPSITITDTFVVGSQSAMLSLVAETGDVAVRTDLSKSYILKGTNPALLADWQELLSPVNGVTSVFGRVGSVTAQTGDYTTAQVTETTNKKYQTDAQALYNDATSPIQTQLNNKVQSVSASLPLGSSGGVSPTISITQSNSTTNGYLSSTDWNTFNNKQNSLTNPITGSTLLSGTTGAGYVPRATASTTLTNSNIYDNGTNVGIGTISPSSPLMIKILTDNNIRFHNDAGVAQISCVNDAVSAHQGLKLGNNWMNFTPSGNVGIGTTSPSEKLTVIGNVLATAFFQSSDLRLKDIISRDGDVIKYKWKDKRDDKIHIGYVAQEVQKENPDQVNADDKGILSVNYIEILVQKIKDLENRIKQLEK